MHKTSKYNSGVCLAVGFGVNHHNELPLDVYRQAAVVVDSLPAAERELKGLIDAGVPLHCELGEKIRGVRSLPDTTCYTVFHSLGKPKLDFFNLLQMAGHIASVFS